MTETAITKLCEIAVQYIWHMIRATSQGTNKHCQTLKFQVFAKLDRYLTFIWVKMFG